MRQTCWKEGWGREWGADITHRSQGDWFSLICKLALVAGPARLGHSPVEQSRVVGATVDWLITANGAACSLSPDTPADKLGCYDAGSGVVLNGQIKLYRTDVL